MNLPDKITVSRFFFGACAATTGIFKWRVGFILFYIFAVLTDIIDGHIARKLKKETKKGAKLDIIADNFLVVCVLIGYYLLRKEMLLKYKYEIFALFGYFIFSQGIVLVFKKKLIFARTLAANLAAILFPVVVLLTLFFDSRTIIYLYIFLMCYSLSEKTVMNLLDTKKIMSSFFSGILFFLLFISIIIIIISLSNNTEYACFREKCISLEIKSSPEERALGLMFRPSLDEDEGMLFIFESEVSHSFWMKNMNFPIDIFFIDSQKKIVDIIKNAQPCLEEPCGLYTPTSNYRYVIETVDGFSEKYRINIGEEVTFP